MPDPSDLKKLNDATAYLARSVENLEDANRSYQQAHLAYGHADAMLRRSAVSAVIALVLFIVALGLFASSRVAPRAPSLHTRRIAVGDRTVTLEIPDGQCAEALGVRVCVPASSAPTSPGKVSP